MKLEESLIIRCNLRRCAIFGTVGRCKVDETGQAELPSEPVATEISGKTASLRQGGAQLALEQA